MFGFPLLPHILQTLAQIRNQDSVRLKNHTIHGKLSFDDSLGLSIRGLTGLVSPILVLGGFFFPGVLACLQGLLSLLGHDGFGFPRQYPHLAGR